MSTALHYISDSQRIKARPAVDWCGLCGLKEYDGEQSVTRLSFISPIGQGLLSIYLCPKHLEVLHAAIEAQIARSLVQPAHAGGGASGVPWTATPPAGTTGLRSSADAGEISRLDG